MAIRTRAAGMALALALALTQGGCAVAVDDAEPADDAVGVNQQAVINGTRATLDALPDNASVRIFGVGTSCIG